MYKFFVVYHAGAGTVGEVIQGQSAYDVKAWVNANLGAVHSLTLQLEDCKADRMAEPMAKTAIQLAQEHSQSLLEQGRREGRAEALTIVLEVLATYSKTKSHAKLVDRIGGSIHLALIK